MRTIVKLASVSCVLCATASCDQLSGFFQANTVRVILVNNGAFDVKVTLYTGDNQNMPESLLTTVGTKRDFTIGPGQSAEFSDDCSDLQAIIVDKAELQTVGTPDDKSNVLRDGSDFGCGDTITFTFEHSLILFDFRVTTNVRS